MKITARTIIFGIIFFAVFSTVFAYEKATIYFKNGEQLDCIVEKYEPGKWADIIEPSGAKKTLKWDVINVIYFKKEEVTPDEITQPAVSPVAITPAVVEAAPVSDLPKTDPVPMNLAQRLAQKEREKKEQEALAAKKSNEPAAAADTRNVKPAQPPVQKPLQPVSKAEEVKGEKATLIYANGDKLDCTIEQYELGKWAVVVDESGTKRIISWDTIKEIIFIKENTPSKSVEEASPLPATSVNVKEEAFKEEIREENKYQQKPEVDYDKDSGKMGVSYYKTLESDAKRRAWIEDGGVLKQTGFTANYTYSSMDIDLGDGDSSFDMHGFGMTYSGVLKWVRPPSYAENKNLWSAFSLGATGSFNITFGSIEMGDTYNTVMDMAVLNYEFSGNIGYTFGLGRYFSSDTWRGVMLALYWKPNMVMSMTTVTMTSDNPYFSGFTDTYDPETSFNMSGMQWTIDFGSFGALADKLAKEAHFSVGGFIIPETDTTPFMLSIGLGLVWY